MAVNTMYEMRAANLMISSLERIVWELKGIEDSELTKAEKNILGIAKDAIEKRNELVLGKKR